MLVLRSQLEDCLQPCLWSDFWGTLILVRVSIIFSDCLSFFSVDGQAQACEGTEGI